MPMAGSARPPMVAAATPGTRATAALALLCCLLLASPPRAGAGRRLAQAATQFVPTGLPAGQGVTARLIYRLEGLADAWKDPATRDVYLQNRVVIEPTFWRSQFPDTGGVATMGPNRTNGANFTITSGAQQEAGRPELNFSGLPSAMLVESGGVLEFRNLLLSDIALVTAYTRSAASPFVNKGTGYGMWPTISLAPNATLRLLNVSLSYNKPNVRDTCEQYNSKTVFGLRQAYGNVTIVNATAGNIAGPVSVTVAVLDDSTNTTAGNATAYFENVTINCLTPQNATQAAGLSPGQLAAAIVVPIVGTLLLAALATCCCLRWRRIKAAEARRKQHLKDLEAGRLQAQASGNLAAPPDQFYPLPQAAPSAALPSLGTASGVSNSSASTLRSFLGLGSGPDPAALETAASARRSVHSTGGSSSSSMRQVRAAAAAGLLPLGVTPSVSAQLPVLPSGGTTSAGPSTSQLESGGLSTQPSSVQQRFSLEGPHSAALLYPASHSIGTASSAAATYSSSLGLVSTGAAAGQASSGEAIASSGGDAAGSAGTSSGGRHSSMSALLKARSDAAVLRDLKIGPLLGRGSYGRVYRGRWKATTVAVKIIEHVHGAPGTASSGGKRISVGNESLLATSISHPNVVQTYHISTMTVSQRTALANAWLAEKGSSSSPGQSPAVAAHAQGDEEHSSNDSNRSSMEGQVRDMLETWIIQELCEKGSLERAINQGRFIRRSDRQPEMVGIYKALLDTASGLDYLHSIGVVHGDLKTANVLLKGSSRDPRGFVCKITDFGLSRVLEMDATHISTGTYGTIVYMPKELLLSGRMTQATDIYSFGLMMWELLTSTRVFDEGISIGQMFYMIAYQGWRPQLPASCPPGYAELMTACWAEDAEQRPTAQALLLRLQKLYVQAKQHLAADRAAEAAAAGAAAAAAAVLSSSKPPSQGSGGSQASAKYRAAASAATQAMACMRAAERRPPSEAASPAPGSGDSYGAPAAAAAAARGSASSAGSDGSNAGSIKDGSDGSAAREYRPFMAAVLQRKRSGSLATGSASSNHLSAGGRTSAGRQQLLWQQQQQVMQQIQEQQQQQQAQRERASGSGTAAAAAGARQAPGQGSSGSGSGTTQPGSSEIEPYDDPAASESLLQHFTSGSHAQYGTDDEPGSSPAYSSPAMQAAQQRLDLRLQQQGLTGDIKMSATTSRQATAASGGPCPAPPTAAAAAAQRGLSSSFRDSFSTGTMPSVLGDSFSGSQTSPSLGLTASMGLPQFGSRRLSSSMTAPSSGPPASPTSASAGSATFGAPPVAAQAPLGAAGGASGPEGAAPGWYQAPEGAGGAAAAPLAAADGGARAIAPASPRGALPRPLSAGVLLQTVHEAGSSSPTHGSSFTAAVPAPALGQSGPATSASQSGPGGASPPQRAPPPASPFTALAQRAGSLFAPLKVVMLG